MEDIRNETLAAGQAAEKVEIPTEETPRTYTEAEFNAKLDEVLGKKLARREAKLRREYERKYGALEEAVYSDRDIALLAKAEAEEIIRAGMEDVVQEVDRLAALGMENMTPREKQRFRTLARHRQEKERSGEFDALGVTAEQQETRQFRDFVSLFQPDTPAERIVALYRSTLPASPIKPMGSMKNNPADENTVKEFYTRDEALKFTKKDFDRNPALYRAVAASMGKW